MKGYEGQGMYVQTLVNSVINEVRGMFHTSAAFSPGKQLPVFSEQEASGTPKEVWKFSKREKISRPCRGLNKE